MSILDTGSARHERDEREALPPVVVLCGSSRFVDVMAVCAWLLERDEHVIALGLHLLPAWYTDVDDHIAEAQGCAEQMDELHLRKIDLAKEIFVVDVGGYIGESTSREIAYAKVHGKRVRLFSEDLLGAAVDALMLSALEKQKEERKKADG